MSSPKLKILCLHGYRQDGVTFKNKLGAFRKMLSSCAEFTFVTAPLKVPAASQVEIEGGEAAETQQTQFGWWFSTEGGTFSSRDVTNLSIGLEQSLQTIEHVFVNQGPFDGVLGFSQGACLAAMLAGLQQQNRLKSFSFKFVIMVAGFKSKSSAHDEFLTQTIGLPSLHVYGETDAVIPKPMSEELLKYFEDPEVVIHPGGHYVPAGKLKEPFLKFLQKMVTLCMPVVDK